MGDPSLRRAAKAAAILIFASAITAVAVSREIPRDHPRLLLSLEFARTAEAVRLLAPADVRDDVQRAQRADSWLFIPSYWVLFVASGVVLVRSRGPRNRVLGIATIALITLAAAFDYAENAAIDAALASRPSASSGPALWAFAKWLLLFACALALSAALLASSTRRVHGTATGLVLGLAGVMGIGATAANVAMVPSAVLGLAVGLLLLALLWIWNPEYLLVND